MERKTLESIPHDGLKNGTHIDVELYYSKGGVSYLSGEISPRGYYVRVAPVTRKHGMLSFVLFTGVSKLLLQTSRFSKRQFEQAVEMAKAATPTLIEQVLTQEKTA